MAGSASGFRQCMYRLLDKVLRTGTLLEIERAGRSLRIVPVGGPSKISRLAAHPGTIVGDPEELVHLDWSGERRP